MGCSSECLSLALNVHHTNNTIVSWVYSLDPSQWPTSVSEGVIVFEEDYITLAEGVVASLDVLEILGFPSNPEIMRQALKQLPATEVVDL